MQKKDADFEKLQSFAAADGFHHGTLAGYAAQAAAETLLHNWRDALGDGNQDNLVSDVDDVIRQLQVFKETAGELLPVRNGGQGGQSLEEWKQRLIAFDAELADGAVLGWLARMHGVDAELDFSTADGCEEERDVVLAAVKRHLPEGGYVLTEFQIKKSRSITYPEVEHTGWLQLDFDDIVFLLSKHRDVSVAFPCASHDVTRQRALATMYAREFPEATSA